MSINVAESRGPRAYPSKVTIQVLDKLSQRFEDGAEITSANLRSYKPTAHESVDKVARELEDFGVLERTEPKRRPGRRFGRPEKTWIFHRDETQDVRWAGIRQIRERILPHALAQGLRRLQVRAFVSSIPAPGEERTSPWWVERTQGPEGGALPFALFLRARPRGSADVWRPEFDAKMAEALMLLSRASVLLAWIRSSGGEAPVIIGPFQMPYFADETGYEAMLNDLGWPDGGAGRHGGRHTLPPWAKFIAATR